MPVPGGDAGDEVGKLVAFLRHRGDNDAALVDLHINGMSSTDREFSGDGSRYAQREAIAPFLQNSFHVDTLTIRQKMLVRQDSHCVDVRRVALSERRRSLSLSSMRRLIPLYCRQNGERLHFDDARLDFLPGCRALR